MDITNLNLVYFSPTRTTARIVESIAKGLGIGTIKKYDFTLPKNVATAECGAEDLAVFAVPVYGGRVPLASVDRIKGIRGHGTPAVLVAVYGNRAYEDALIELSDIVTECGFKPVAAAAFIGEHSFATQDLPTAMGRPDAKDLDHGADFGRKVAEKVAVMDAPEAIEVSGDRPYKERKPKGDMAPVTDMDKCVKCGECVDLCPTQAITLDDEISTDGMACILCCACEKFCPEGARYWTAPRMGEMRTWLNANCAEPKQPEYFL